MFLNKFVYCLLSDYNPVFLVQRLYGAEGPHASIPVFSEDCLFDKHVLWIYVDDQGPDFDDMSSFFPCEIDDAIQYINLGYGAQCIPSSFCVVFKF